MERIVHSPARAVHAGVLSLRGVGRGGGAASDDRGWARGIEVPRLAEVVRAKRPLRLPTVRCMSGAPWLVSLLIYGAGVRLLACLRLRVKDVDFAGHLVRVRAGQGYGDRVANLRPVVRDALRVRLAELRAQHERDLADGGGFVELPTAIARTCPNAAREWGWQRVFPAARMYCDRESRELRRHHLHETVLQRAVKCCRGRSGAAGAGDLPYVPALVCDAPARRWL